MQKCTTLPRAILCFNGTKICWALHKILYSIWKICRKIPIDDTKPEKSWNTARSHKLYQC